MPFVTHLSILEQDNLYKFLTTKLSLELILDKNFLITVLTIEKFLLLINLLLSLYLALLIDCFKLANINLKYYNNIIIRNSIKNN